jgi:hypothetical protein
MINIKMIFGSSPGIGKHFVGKALCSSNESVTYLIHILQFFMTSIFYKPQEKKYRGIKSGE